MVSFVINDIYVYCKVICVIDGSSVIFMREKSVKVERKWVVVYFFVNSCGLFIVCYFYLMKEGDGDNLIWIVLKYNFYFFFVGNVFFFVFDKN